ncbi:MAG: tetratricopeptide repeat protein [Oculatellaceae cyanobacterium Prado106]|jgi:tetratricopeptide (TPR) repeat protein|nr:tetratricopeptide repeat protein [Oculatellaceae cyanobacterium Prado106]
MSESLRDRYLNQIDRIAQMTLKGEIRSKEQVYQMLVEQVESGTGEIFERCLGDRLTETQHQVDTQTDELKQARASRTLRALSTIQGEWVRWQEKNQATAALDTAVRQIIHGLGTEEHLSLFLSVTDPNQPKPLSLAQWQQLAKKLQQDAGDLSPDWAPMVHELAQGITRSLEDWGRLENHLVSWIYDQSRGQLGFEGVPGDRGPWATWAKQVKSPVPQALFQTLAMGGSAVEWVERQNLSLGDFVEVVGVLRCLQQGLVNWFDKLVYDSKVGSKLSISTFLAFSILWSQLANGFAQTTPNSNLMVNACFQITLQILRTFAQCSYFPLYGGIFASFSGEYLRDALDYLDEPLRQAEGTQEKARVLTLLGSSTRALGQIERAIAFHQEALDIARTAEDSICEVANLNHLSRTCVVQKNYSEAINYAQRAVILSRQKGDRLGEANAIANLGYSEVLQAQALEQADPDLYEMAVDRLQQGLDLADKVGDRQSQALCLSSLGIAYLVLEKAEGAIAYFEKGIQAAQFTGDLYLQGLNLTYLGEAYYRLEDYSKTIQTASLGMYLLEQIASTSWRQAAGLLTILRGQVGTEEFQRLLGEVRSAIIPVIGVDGYDALPDLLEQYQGES